MSFGNGRHTAKIVKKNIKEIMEILLLNSIFPMIGKKNNFVSGIIRLPSGWDFSVCIGDR